MYLEFTMEETPGNCDDKDVNISPPAFHRTNSLPVPRGINTENLIIDKNRGSIGVISVPNQLENFLQINRENQEKGK